MPLNSAFAHRLNTNYVARPGEEAAIRDVMNAHATPIHALEKEIDEIEKTIETLETLRTEKTSRRNEYLTFFDGHRQLLSSILRLSEDVLLTIFSNLSPRPLEWSIDEGDPHPIVQLSHVCRQWRTISVSTPSLWAILSITDLPYLDESNDAALEEFEKRMQRVIEMVSTWVARAARFPITLLFSADDRNFSPHPPTSEKLVRRLVEILRQARWGDIDITLRVSRPSSPFAKLLDTPQHSGDAIRRARISLLSASAISFVLVDHLNTMNARQLNSLEISMPGGNVHTARVHWAALTELKLSGCITMAWVAIVLGRCPNLVQCTLDLNHEAPPPSRPPSTPPPVTLRYLQILKLSGYYTTERLPASLHLPSLNTLSILDTAYPPVTPFHTVLLEWIRIYGTQLRAVKFTYSRLTLPVLLSCLQGLPDLLSLDLRLPTHRSNFETVAHFGRTILPAMAPEQGEGHPTTAPLCPKLESFVVYVPTFNVHVEDWVSFIASRRQKRCDGAVAFLKRIHVYFQPVDSSAESAQVAQVEVSCCLREMGVDMDGVDLFLHTVKHAL